MFKQERERFYKGIALCIVAFIVGERFLHWVAPMEDPPMGNTIYIILGSTLMIGSVVAVFMIIKELRKLKRKERKRRNNPVIFLDSQKKKKKSI